ncbi:MAG: XisI protein [Caldilineaceae bacterium]
MDRVEELRKPVVELIERFAGYKPAYGEIENEAVFDYEHGHYHVMSLGWEGNERVHYCVMHLDIKDGKIWIQHNATDVDIAEELVDAGVPKDKIVLAMHPASPARIYWLCGCLRYTIMADSLFTSATSASPTDAPALLIALYYC